MELKIKGPPEPPAGASVKGDCAAYNARVTWRRGQEIGVETRKFYIEYSTNVSALEGEWFGGQGKPVREGEEMMAEPGTITYYILDDTNLVPGADLIFRVRAASDHLVGLHGTTTKQGNCITPPGPPKFNPFNVTGLVTGAGKLTIKWKPLQKLFHGGKGFYYEIGHRPLGNSKFTKREFRDLEKDSLYNIPSPGTYKQHQFYVRAMNDLGPGPEPTIVTAYSGRPPPAQAPRRVMVGANLRFSTELIWTPVENADGYRVTFWNITDAESMRGMINLLILIDLVLYTVLFFCKSNF